MDLEKYRTELNSFSTRIQNANRVIKERTVLSIFDFKRFKEELNKIKTRKERLQSIEQMLHANIVTANEQTLKIENTLHEMKNKHELFL